MFNKERDGLIDLEVDVILGVENAIRINDTVYTRPEELDEQRNAFCKMAKITRESYDDVVLHMWGWRDKEEDEEVEEEPDTAWYYSGEI